MKTGRFRAGLGISGALLLGLTGGVLEGQEPKPEGKLLFQDDFEREESQPEREEVGNGWGTNSASRAQGQKQVDLREGAARIERAAVADHGVSLYQDVEFRDAVISLRFKLGKRDDLGINLADMKEKSVHAGHICMAKVRLNRLEIVDLKTGQMKLEVRQLRQEKKLSPEMKKLVDRKSKFFDLSLKADEWHQLEVRVEGETMRVSINGKPAGEFQSDGIGHSTKRRLRVAVGRSAWIDDVKIVGLGTP